MVSRSAGGTTTGPVWMPINAILIRALLTYYTYYGDAFTVECPTGSGRHMTLFEIAQELARRPRSQRTIASVGELVRDQPRGPEAIRERLLYRQMVE